MTRESTARAVEPVCQAGLPAGAGVATALRYASASRAAFTRDKCNRAWDAFT